MISSRTHSRWAPARSAAWFALGFVVLRLVYRVLFLGANGSGLVLYSGRPLHLDGPFRFISILGPVTTGGLWNALVDALPFAAGILVIGVVVSLVDVRNALARVASWHLGRGVLTALAIGVSTYPSLVTTWRSMRQVHRLRRERGWLSVLAPLFERTLERSSTLAISMEARGFGRSAHEPELDCSAPLDFSDLSLAHSERWFLREATASARLGELILLTGSTGSGKSTLLRAIAGLHTHGSREQATGSLSIGGADRFTTSVATSSAFVSFVGQNVRDSFVAATVKDELAFALRMQGMPSPAIEVRLREVVQALRLDELLTRRVEELSAGESVLVALGAALVTRPTLLLLDEPLADLDANQAAHVVALLERLAHTTLMTIVVAEHRTRALSQLGSTRWHLADCRLVAAEACAEACVKPPAAAPVGQPARAESAISALVGPNGSGKTTKLFKMALSDPAGIALVPESLGDFFVRDTVAAECSRSDHTARAAIGTTLKLVRQLIPLDNAVLSTHPRDLSAGQQLALAIAIALAAEPQQLLIDEPTRGLDATARANLVEMLNRVSEYVSVTVASHDAGFIELINARAQAVNA